MKKIFSFIVLLCSISACKKFLDKKPGATLLMPSTAEHLLAMTNEVNFNQRDPSSGEKSADDYYLAYTDWLGFSETERRMYTWEKDFLMPKSSTLNEWPYLYQMVFRGNVILDMANKIERRANDDLVFNTAIGRAYFLRGKGFYNVVTIYALAYDPQTANTTLGIPLRLDPDFNTVSVRANLQDSYDQIISDFKNAASLLPDFPEHLTIPSRPAAYAYLARTYLLMREFDSARRYADLSLQIKSNLLDYNTVNATLPLPFSPRFSNPEVIYDCVPTGSVTLSQNVARIDSALYSSYATNDLRKVIFFKSNNNGTYGMKGDYAAFGNMYTGLATDEIYLIRAECRARTGDLNGALNDLNTLLIKRWKTGLFQNITAGSSAEALGKILIERRKELLFRGLRWTDIKRLNIVGANISLTRKLNGQTFTLSPNHPRFALPIPDDAIQISGMPQNPR